MSETTATPSINCSKCGRPIDFRYGAINIGGLYMHMGCQPPATQVAEINRLRAALATARAEERERCAKVAENYSTMAHIAWDGHIGIFPKWPTTHDYIAAAIRALTDEANNG